MFFDGVGCEGLMVLCWFLVLMNKFKSVWYVLKGLLLGRVYVWVLFR